MGDKCICECDDSEALVIPGVDFDMLEYQRKMLIGILIDTNKCIHMSQEQVDALDGLLNMLDAWSDARYGIGGEDGHTEIRQ